MGLSVGIVGLPNVGKSTTFNALTSARNAEAANYPFCTINAHSALVPVADARLGALAAIAKPKEIIPALVSFTDIAGLVAGASKGEGLGNQFLANIRECAAILHLVRCFDDANVIHVDGAVDPARDIAVIDTELVLADLQSLEKRIERLDKQARTDKKLVPQLELAKRLLAHLDTGAPASAFKDAASAEYESLNQEMRFVSGKPVIYGANVDEAALAEDNAYVTALREYIACRNPQHGGCVVEAATRNAGDAGTRPVVKICAKIEEELIDMSAAERVEFLESLGARESGLDQIVHAGYAALGLMSYFTAGPKEVRAWTIERGTKAPRAAAVIHNDFERGFIRAEVISYNDYIARGGEAGARAAGVLRTEGKEYVVQDGDVMHFLFNV
ncbi:MAG: redox-regulated ATPase YchF [Spirochaetota bacterium]|nr:redox-regulated ATPase YchF [Spirochaetota bacterium]